MTTPGTAFVIQAVLLAHVAEHTTGHYRSGGKWKVLCSCGHVSKYMGDPDFDDTAHAAHQASVVLAAVAEAGAVEWAIFRMTDEPDGSPFDSFTHTTKNQAASRIERMYPAMADQLEPRSRVAGPWERAK